MLSLLTFVITISNWALAGIALICVGDFLMNKMSPEGEIWINGERFLKSGLTLEEIRELDQAMRDNPDEIKIGYTDPTFKRYFNIALITNVVLYGLLLVYLFLLLREDGPYQNTGNEVEHGYNWLLIACGVVIVWYIMTPNAEDNGSENASDEEGKYTILGNQPEDEDRHINIWKRPK